MDTNLVNVDGDALMHDSNRLEGGVIEADTGSWLLFPTTKS